MANNKWISSSLTSHDVPFSKCCFHSFKISLVNIRSEIDYNQKIHDKWTTTINISRCQHCQRSPFASVYKDSQLFFESPPFSRFLFNLGWPPWRARRPRLATRWSPPDWTCRRSGPRLRPSYRSVPTHILLSSFCCFWIFALWPIYVTLLGASVQVFHGCTYDTRYRICLIFLILEWNLLSVYVWFASVLVMVQSGVGFAIPVPLFSLFCMLFCFFLRLFCHILVKFLLSGFCRQRFDQIVTRS